MSAWRDQLTVRWNQLCRPARLALKSGNDWLLGRAPRERVLLASAVFVTVAALWYSSTFAPQATRLTQLNNNLSRVEQEQMRLDNTIRSLKARQEQAEDPDEPLREEIAEVEKDLEALNEELVTSGLDFISTVTMDEAMAELRRLLEAPDAPALDSFERRRGEGIAASEDSAVRELDIRHREIALTFEADFPTTTQFLETLESGRQQLVWRRLEYQVIDYPMARVNLRFDLYAPTELD